jgi:hypothetical protein
MGVPLVAEKTGLEWAVGVHAERRISKKIETTAVKRMATRKEACIGLIFGNIGIFWVNSNHPRG